MLCTRRTKTLVSTCVILSGMTNIVCLLYVGWITNYVANSGPKVAESGGGGEAERKLEEDSKGETLRIIERLDRLESVVNEHIKGQSSRRGYGKVWSLRGNAGLGVIVGAVRSDKAAIPAQ